MNDSPKPAMDESSAGLYDATLCFSGGRLFLGAVRDGEALALADEECKSLGDFQSLYFSNPLFTLPYRSMDIIVDDGGGYDLVPSPFLTEEQSIGLWLKGLQAGETVLKELLPDQECGVVFSVKDEVREFVERSFSRQTFHHPVTGLCLSALQYSRRNDGDCLFALVSGSPEEPLLDVAHARKGKLTFANRFHLHGETDALYYLTAVWRSEGLDQEKSALSLYGDRLSASFRELLRPLSNALRSFAINEYGTRGTEPNGTSLFPASIRLKMLCV